jgi:hypothetical protein
MSGKLLFVHGTGVRDVSPALGRIRAGMKRVLGWADEDVVPVEWGRAVGIQDLDVRSALPPEQAVRALAGGGLGAVAAEAGDAEVWDLLLADPTIELRVLAQRGPDDEVKIDISVDAPEIQIEDSLRNLVVPEAALAAAGFSGERVSAATEVLLSEDALIEAASAASDADASTVLVEALADAIVATMIVESTSGLAPDELVPAAAADSDAREAFAEAVAAALAPGAGRTRGIIGDKIVAPLATKLAIRKRAAFMGSFSDFSRDVTFYLRRGQEIRAFIAKAVRDTAGAEPLIVLAHSLGGIAAVDLLADPKEMTGTEGLRVDLLVTVGSQAPLLYLMDSLDTLRPGRPRPTPFVPWLNIYDPEDLLAFCAERVFAAQTGIVDKAVDTGVPFPWSHSAYWTRNRTYELIRDQLAK